MSNIKTATFGMECFWCPEPVFGLVKGVIRTRVGYSGGTKLNPTYTDLGDHTEVVDIDYDVTQVTYGHLLKLFWENHDPTAAKKTQYISVIFYHDDEQKSLAENSIAEQKKISPKPILTLLRKAQIVYEAEDYHQKYRLQQDKELMSLMGAISPADMKKSHLTARLNGYAGGFGTISQLDEEWKKIGLNNEQADYIREKIKSGKGPICH